MNLKPIDDKITVVLDMIERQHKNPHVAPDEKAATKRDLADLMLLKADLIKANPVNLTGSTIKIPDFDQHGTCPHCDNGHSLEPDETCETCNRYNAAAGRLCDPIPISAAKRIAKNTITIKSL